MKRKLFVLVTVLVAASILVTPVLAITFGELDGELHPNVGALLVAWPYPDGVVDLVCTGTLISPTVFLTAAHCVNWMPAYDIDPHDVYVTFDSVYEISVSTIYRGTYYINPNYGHDSADPHDIAVVVLDQPITDITPASLPPAGLLDQMKDTKELKDRQFVAVGYGTVRDDKTGGPHALYWEGARRYVSGTYNALTQSWLKISMNPATGDGGTCYGDSGGPHFLDYNGNTMVVSLTVTGDAQCRATDVTYRLDTPSARSYLAPFVTLP
jgi:secreted trypsin-like serine protease